MAQRDRGGAGLHQRPKRHSCPPARKPPPVHAEHPRQPLGPARTRRARRRSRVLCIDEVGYLSYGNRHADLLFEVITRRYEANKPVIVTTNRPFGEWGEVFPSAACVVTLVDRLVHRSEVVLVEGASYRLKEAKERKEQRRRQGRMP